MSLRTLLKTFAPILLLPVTFLAFFLFQIVFDQLGNVSLPPPQIFDEKPYEHVEADPTALKISQAISQKNLDEIIDIIAQLSPNTHAWVKSLKGKAVLEVVDTPFTDDMNTFYATVVSTYNAPCFFVKNPICEKLDRFTTYVLVNAQFPKEQPYVLTSILVHELSHVRAIVGRRRYDCFEDEIEARRQEVAFWKGLPAEKHARYFGFTHQLLDTFEYFLEAEQEGQLEELVRETYKDICETPS